MAELLFGSEDDKVGIQDLPKPDVCNNLDEPKFKKQKMSIMSDSDSDDLTTLVMDAAATLFLHMHKKMIEESKTRCAEQMRDSTR